MAMFRIGEAAVLLGVSADTVRRWADQNRLRTTRTEGGQRLVDGIDLAKIAAERSQPHEFEELLGRSARNRFVGIITAVKKGDVVSQVEIQAGPHRVVSLLTSEAVDDLGLEPGKLALAIVKSTNVVIEVPR